MWAITRREHRPEFRPNSRDYIGCYTKFDPTAPIHPRCSEHANADAYVLDGVKPDCPYHGKTVSP